MIYNDNRICVHAGSFIACLDLGASFESVRNILGLPHPPHPQDYVIGARTSLPLLVLLILLSVHAATFI